MQQPATEQSKEALTSQSTTTISQESNPKINIMASQDTAEEPNEVQFNFNILDNGINKVQEQHKLSKSRFHNELQIEVKGKNEDNSLKIATYLDNYENTQRSEPITQRKNPNQQVSIASKQKIKISMQHLEKLSSQEKFDLAVQALNQPANQRNPVEQKLIEDTIDSFAYIQKMKKRKPTLAKQVARVVEHQKCKKGQAVFYAGQQPEKFYLILRGKVAVLLKKSDAQIAMDRKNGKVVHIQNYLDHRKFQQNNQSDLISERKDSLDSSLLLNSTNSPLRLHSPSNFAQKKNSVFINQPNSPLLKANDNPVSNNMPNGLFGRKSSVQAMTAFNSSALMKHRGTSIFSGQFFNDKTNDSPLSTENTQPSPLELNPSQYQRENSNLNSSELNTPTLKSNSSSKANNGSSGTRPRHSVASKSISQLRQELKQQEFITKNLHLTIDDLEEIEKFYDNGVFRYEFAKELEQGAAFGEMGLLLKVPRTATILATEDTDFVCMSKQNYQQIIKSLENFKLENKIQFFHQALHYDFKIEEFGKLCIDFSQKKKFIKDQHIFKEGEKAKEVLVIKSGEVELYKTVTGSDGKKKKIQLSYIGPGEILGVEELFYSKEERYYNAKCLHEVKAYYINKYLFIRLMHEIADLKTIMEQRAKNKLKWQEFKVQEVLEQQQIDGIVDKNQDLGLPESDKQVVLLAKTKKSKKGNNLEAEDYGAEVSQIKQQDIHTQQQTIKDEKQDSQLLKHSKSDLMVAHARKQHVKNEELNMKSTNYNKFKVVHDESLRGYDKIENQLKKKEQVLELIEKNTNNSILFQNYPNDKSKLTDREQPQQSYVCNANWFDMEKKKQLEQKIADAIKIRRQPPGTTKIHLKLKQKVDTLPPVVNTDSSTLQTTPGGVTSISSLPQDIQKKLKKFKKERDRSQFNEYINSLTEIAQDELSSPVSTSSGYKTAFRGLKSISSRTSLSLVGNDKSSKQQFFANSELSMGELNTPSPRASKLNGRAGALHSSLSQLVSLPHQIHRSYQGYQMTTKTNNSQSSFQDIMEEPYLESQQSQKNIDSEHKKFNIFTSIKKVQQQQQQQQLQQNPPLLQKQSTLQELEDEFEQESKIKGKSSLEHLDTLEDQSKKQEKIQAENYYVKPTSQTKIRAPMHEKKQKLTLIVPPNQQMNSIQYKSLNEIEQILEEQSNASHSQKGSFQHYFPNHNHTNQSQQFGHLQQQSNLTNLHSKSSLNLPSIKHSENLLSHLVSPTLKNKPLLQGGFKRNRILKKSFDGGKIGNLNDLSQKALERAPPEFIIKSHKILNQDSKQNIHSTSRQSFAQNNQSSNTSPPQTGVSNPSNINNFRSQSFQIKISHVN